MKKISEMVKIFGSKSTHMVTIEAGGVTTKPTADRLVKYISLSKEAKYFIENCYIPDVIEVAKQFKEYFKIGKGVNNFLTFDTLLNLDGSYLFTGGFSQNFKYEDGIDPYNIIEYNNYAYYKQNGGYKPLELTELTPLTFDEFKTNQTKYSWSKAPRYKGYVVSRACCNCNK